MVKKIDHNKYNTTQIHISKNVVETPSLSTFRLKHL